MNFFSASTASVNTGDDMSLNGIALSVSLYSFFKFANTLDSVLFNVFNLLYKLSIISVDLSDNAILSNAVANFLALEFRFAKFTNEDRASFLALCITIDFIRSVLLLSFVKSLT